MSAEVWAAIGAMGSFAAAVLLWITTREYTRKTGQMVDEMTDARFATQRPVLYPVGGLMLEPGGTEVDWNQRDMHIMIANVGTGPALNVHALLLPRIDPAHNSGMRYSYWIGDVLDVHGRDVLEFTRGQTLVSPITRIGAATLGPPQPPGAGAAPAAIILARLTLYYEDIFARRHATTVDYTAMKRWEHPCIMGAVDESLMEQEDKAQAAIRLGNQQPMSSLPGNITL